MNTIEKLKAAFAQTSQGEWLVCPTLRPDLDDDPMAEYTIKNHQAGLMHRYFEADIDSDELAKVHKENAANAEFIALAHGLIPTLLAELERLQKLQGKPSDTGLAAILRDLKAFWEEGAKQAWSDLAYPHFPAIAEEIERLQWLDAELDRVRQRANFFELTLRELLLTMSDMRGQLEQMRGLFDDEDGASQAACTGHDRAMSMLDTVDLS